MIFGQVVTCPWLRLFLSRYQPVIAPSNRGGKSGQYRAAYRLTAGVFGNGNRESATENNCLDANRDEGENGR